MDASGLAVERVYFAAEAANKYTAAHHGRLCVGAGAAGKPERPFQFEPGNILRREPRHGRGLEAMLQRVDAPAVPMRPRQRINERGARRGTGCIGR
jgi:hypothetical protein